MDVGPVNFLMKLSCQYFNNGFVRRARRKLIKLSSGPRPGAGMKPFLSMVTNYEELVYVPSLEWVTILVKI